LGLTIEKIITALMLIGILCSFSFKSNLKGLWEYSGGIYNGKPEAASKDYKLQRKYDVKQYEAMFLETGEKPMLYEKGNYELKQDTCLETQTFSVQPSKLLNVTVRYKYQIKNDTLTFSGILPNGTIVQEYWKRVK
jgi:hypothetical protein